MVCPAQALAAKLAPQFDADNVMSGLSSMTAQQLTSIVGGRHVYVGCGRVSQEVGHSLKEYGPFDLVIIMAGINYLGVSAHPVTTTHDVLTLYVTCHRAGVRTVFLSLPPNTGTKRDVQRCYLYASRWEYLNMTLGQTCWSEDGAGSFTAGIHMTGQRFSPYGEGLSREPGVLDVCVCGLNGLTALPLSEEVDARLFVDVGCKRGQQLGSVLEERVPFDVLLIMAGTNDLVMRVAPGMALHSIQTLLAECQIRGVLTVALRHYAAALLMSALHTLALAAKA